MREKEILSGLAGALDPLIRELAQKLAGLVSPESPWRSAKIESAVGVLKGWAEAYAEKFAPLAAVAVEKVTDLLDFMSVSLAQGETSEQAARNWREKFLAESLERIKKSTDPEAELEKIKAELKLQQELMRAVLENGAGKILGQFSAAASKLGGFLKTADETAGAAIENWRRNNKWIKKGR